VSAAHAETRATFDIAPQALDAALYEFAAQANVSLALPDAGVGGARSAGVRGAMAPEEALRRLLEGSGYVFRSVGPGAYRILAAPHASNDIPVENIVVTAARRPTPLNELPRAVTHLNSQDLQDAGALDLNNLVLDVSGMSRTNTGLGRDKILLRGISDGALTGQSQSTVGLYFNGLRLTYAAPDPDLELVDIQDVDILRGPQGALYGAGSIGGIVQIETNPVDLNNPSFGAEVDGTSVEGGHMGSNVAAVANLPVVPGHLGVRAVGYNQEFGGWLDNDVTGAADTNSARRRGGRLTTTLAGDGWDASVFGIYQTIDAQDAQYARLGDDDARSTNLLEPHDNDFLSVGFALHASLPFGELSSTTASVRHQIGSRYDATGSFAALGVDPLQVRPFDEKQTLDIVIHETRLTSLPGARQPWLVGVFYADGDNRRDNVLRDGAIGVWDSSAYAEQRTDAVDEAAVFGEITWPIASQLSLSTGLRLFRFHVKTQSQTQEPLLATSNAFSGALAATGAAPDVRLAYQFNPDAMFYLSVARGYRGGGFNTGGPAGAISSLQQPFQRFSGDSLVATELGTRLSLLSRRLNVNAAIFYYRWNDVQTDSLIAGEFPYTGNVGDGRALGFEGEARYALTQSLTMSANVLINEPEITQRDPRYPGALDGNFPGAPEFSGGIALRYRHALQWAGGWLVYGGIDTAYVGRSSLGFDDGAKIGGYLTANLQLGLRNPDWDLSLFVDNATSADDRTFSVGNPYAAAAGPYVTPPTPRTIGLSLRRNF
jgi:outer membrane receptor protein involved in Fe transport